MSMSEFGISYQQVSHSQPAESSAQFKVYHCGKGGPNFQITNTSESGGSLPITCPNCQVEILCNQLQNERKLRASLEAGLMNLRRGLVSFPSIIDSKIRADLEDVATAETDIMNLKQKVSGLRGQLSNQAQLSPTSLCESCNKRYLNMDKLVKYERSAALCSEVSSSVQAPPIARPNSRPNMILATDMVRMQNSCSSVQAPPIARPNSRPNMILATDMENDTFQADIEQTRKHTTQHLLPSIDKPAHLKQQLTSDCKRDMSSGDRSTAQRGSINQRAQRMLSSKSEILKDSLDSSVTSMWNFAQRQYSNSQLISKVQGFNAYSSTKTEESGATPSALAKLTSRVNFLKERRALLASEMQNLDLTRPQDPTAPKRDSR